jgi:hypothetical protein
MSDITAQIGSDTFITTSITSQNNVYVSAVGIQGSSAVLGPDSTVASIGDVDSSTLVNGSLLIYKTGTSKWTASTLLDAQNMEGGEF